MTHTRSTLDSEAHPLCPRALLRLVNSMIWDGREPEALLIADFIVENHGRLEQLLYGQWLGVWLTLRAVAARRASRRQMRPLRRAIAELTAALNAGTSG